VKVEKFLLDNPEIGPRAEQKAQKWVTSEIIDVGPTAPFCSIQPDSIVNITYVLMIAALTYPLRSL